ncbi:IS630 family transposase [Candidatus Parcubacteria bacterium]|nr:MAG: IS630 family transposase [Candidatus Parcubacteria bacterium]
MLRSRSGGRGSGTKRLFGIGAKQSGPRSKKAQAEGWSIVLIDESGFMLQPVVRRTWAPRGQTPIQYSWDRHDRLSVIAALTLAPRRRRVGLYFQVFDRNIRAEEVVMFLKQVHRHVRRKLLVVWDRYSVHRKAARLLREAGAEWLEVVWLPAYAPDLNPVEMVWNHSKYSDLANFLPEDIGHLEEAVNASMNALRQKHGLKRSFFAYAGLEL